jgi:alpha-L-arabinofuranosidase
MQERKPQRNIWGYHQSRGLGYYEFFQFCEDLGCEPLPVVPAAVPCQNSSTGGGGQQGGIPFGPEFEQYKQDLLDLIEWANGDPKTSKWAKMRADAGHPKPFNLKYLGIGNEDLISDVFTERYLPLIKAVKERYPEITVCGTTGPFFEGSDYEQGWRLAKDNHIDMVDEHYYVAPGWYINNQHFYDQYDRSASKVYLGEYASHGPGRKSTIQTALTCAMHICNLERNGDVVAMSSYAPLLAKHGHTQWNPDLIYFDNERVYPTVDYYVQRLCGQSQGNEYLPTAIRMDGPDRANRRLAASTVHDTTTGKTFVKLVNLLPYSVETTLDFAGIDVPAGTMATTTVLAGAWADEQARPTQPAPLALSAQTTLSLPAYSFTVIAF